MEFSVQVTSTNPWWPSGTVSKFFVTTRKTALTRFVNIFIWYKNIPFKQILTWLVKKYSFRMYVQNYFTSDSIWPCKLYLVLWVIVLCVVHSGDRFYRWCRTETPNWLICLKTTLMERAKCGWLCVSIPKGTSSMRQ